MLQLGSPQPESFQDGSDLKFFFHREFGLKKRYFGDLKKWVTLSFVFEAFTAHVL